MNRFPWAPWNIHCTETLALFYIHYGPLTNINVWYLLTCPRLTVVCPAPPSASEPTVWLAAGLEVAMYWSPCTRLNQLIQDSFWKCTKRLNSRILFPWGVCWSGTCGKSSLALQTGTDPVWFMNWCQQSGPLCQCACTRGFAASIQNSRLFVPTRSHSTAQRTLWMDFSTGKKKHHWRQQLITDAQTVI